tara:strand:- start:38584 stop:38931 length:348 start_codon:yes stop_codon:yes gene_type:complete
MSDLKPVKYIRGRSCALLLEVFGWAMIALGLALAVKLLLQGLQILALLPALSAASAGLFALLAAHAARALFDLAQDTRAIRLGQKTTPANTGAKPAATHTPGMRAEPSLRRPAPQ